MRRRYGLPYISIWVQNGQGGLPLRSCCVRLSYSPRTASNKKEIVWNEEDTRTSPPARIKPSAEGIAQTNLPPRSLQVLYICAFSPEYNTVQLIMVLHLKLFSICGVTGHTQSSANICHAPDLARLTPTMLCICLVKLLSNIILLEHLCEQLAFVW